MVLSRRLHCAQCTCTMSFDLFATHVDMRACPYGTVFPLLSYSLLLFYQNMLLLVSKRRSLQSAVSLVSPLPASSHDLRRPACHLDGELVRFSVKSRLCRRVDRCLLQVRVGESTLRCPGQAGVRTHRVRARLLKRQRSRCWHWTLASRPSLVLVGRSHAYRGDHWRATGLGCGSGEKPATVP